MTASLRQRKRVKTMVRIQTSAMELFHAHGYANVTVEQIAAAAEVAPATVYRYFETKTGFFTIDPVENPGYENAEFVHELADDPQVALQALFDHIEKEDTEKSGGFTGMRFVLEVPEVRAAVVLNYVQRADDIARMLVKLRGVSEMRARVFARGLMMALFTAIEQWHVAGRSTPLATYIEEACRGIRLEK